MARRKWNWRNVSLPEDAVEKIGVDFERGLYEVALADDPDNIDVLVALGDLYTKQGLLENGLEVDLKLVKIRPSVSVFHYNLACSHSLLGHLDPAFAALKRALHLGYDDVEHLVEDRDLDNLKSDRRYTDLLKRLEKKKLIQ